MCPRKAENFPKTCNPTNCDNEGLTGDVASEVVERDNGRQELSRLTMAGLTLSETQHAPSSSLPAHVHDTASICLTLAGQGLEISKSIRIITKPGGVILRAPKVIHSDQYGTVPARSFLVELEDRWLETCQHFFRLFETYRYFSDGPVSALMLRIYRESRIKDSVAPVIVEGLMLELLGHASRSLIKTPIRPPGWLIQARDLLHGRYTETLSLDQIAELVGVHPTHLSRTFKKYYRVTVGEYQRRLRLDWATQQLSEGQHSIAEIASAAGFYDQSHFSHLFKQHTGFTPAEFRVLLKRPR